jgi:hypothetical protein
MATGNLAMGIDFALGTGDQKTPTVLGFVLEGIIQDNSVADWSAVNAKRAFFASERSMTERVGNAFFTHANADSERFQNFQMEKPRIDCRPVKMAGEKSGAAVVLAVVSRNRRPKIGSQFFGEASNAPLQTGLARVFRG